MSQVEVEARHITDEAVDPRDRYSLYRLCDCLTCEGKGKATYPMQLARWEVEYGETAALSGKCPECRGEGKVRQEVSCAGTKAEVGMALVTGAEEGEWEGCAFGLLDRFPDCPECERKGCPTCKGSGIKSTGTWLVLPWLPSPRNVRDAAKLLRSKRQ